MAVIVDFASFKTMPVAFRKMPRERCNEVVSQIAPFRRINTSSTNSKWVRVHSSVIFIPLIHLCLQFSLMVRLRPSMMRRNSNGESGHPFLSPLSAWKNGEAKPLISTLKDTFMIQQRIHLMKE